MNLRRFLCASAAVTVLLIVGGACEARSINPWGRPTYSGYPAYGYQYYNVHHHHYVYRPHYHHWHPSGWGNHGMYGGWYGGGFIWHGPGNCEACYSPGVSDYGQRNVEGGAADTEPDDVPVEPIPDPVPDLPTLPSLP